MPEWSNGADSKSVGLVPTKVRILSPALREHLRCPSLNLPLKSALVAQFGLEHFPPKEGVAGSNPVKGNFCLIDLKKEVRKTPRFLSF